jgi:hypothetical protein
MFGYRVQRHHRERAGRDTAHRFGVGVLEPVEDAVRYVQDAGGAVVSGVGEDRDLASHRHHVDAQILSYLLTVN